MAEDAQGAVLERSPGETSPAVVSPDSGLGVSPEESPEQAATDKQKQAEAYQKLQSERDKEREARIRAERALERARHEQEVREAMAKSPDPNLYPEEAARYKDEVAEHYARRLRSENAMQDELNDFMRRTNVIIDKKDARLDIKSLPDGVQGWNLFKSRLKEVEDEVTGKKAASAPVDVEKIRKELREELLKELGVDKFDGGQPQGTAGAMTLARFRSLDLDARLKLRREQPDVYDRLLSGR